MRTPRIPVQASLMLLLVAVTANLAFAQPQGTPAAAPTPATPPANDYKNLRVLPKDIPPAELRALMNSFTRALGVRCIHCHVGQEGRPFRDDEFPMDDKPTKLKARAMMQMVRDINEKYLATLDHRADPPVKVECVTCHHGNTIPRTLQSELRTAYASGGLDSTLARYNALRGRYYGTFTYDFGEVPLADVGTEWHRAGHDADAESLLAYNVTMNPNSAFAKRQLAAVILRNAFRRGAADGAATVAQVRTRFGDASASEQAINAVGYDLLASHETAAAVTALKQNVTDHPASANAYDSYGEALLAAGDRKGALAAYTKSLALDPKNTDAEKQIDAIKHPAKKSGGKDR